MDWYFASGIEDFVVPKDQEFTDRLPSPESWSNWGYSAPGNFESFNKCFDVDANMTHEELKFNGRLSNGSEFETSADAKDLSSFPSVCGGSSEESLNQTPTSHSQPKYQLDDFARFQQMDNIFLSSLVEDLLGGEDLQRSFCFSPEDQCGRMPADYLSTDGSLDSQSISNNEHGMGSAKYLKTHAFPQLMTLEKETPASDFIPCKSGLKNSPSVKAPPAKILVPLEQKTENGYASEGISLEESVLQELEIVTAQLSDKTRICFRDAFYRLAKNSKENPVAPSQHENLYERTHFPMSPVSEEKMRSGRKEATESKTNTIDRAIANLTFNKMESNARNFLRATPAKSKQDAIGVTRQTNESSSQSGINYFPQSPISSSDAEVPFFRHKKLRNENGWT